VSGLRDKFTAVVPFSRHQNLIQRDSERRAVLIRLQAHVTLTCERTKKGTKGQKRVRFQLKET
jgi:hypothetical protein